jgi:copper chaperone
VSLLGASQHAGGGSPVSQLTHWLSPVQVVLRVDMTCEGCVNAVKRILGKTEGVESFDVDLALKKVTVRGSVSAEALVEKVGKMGKDTSLWV